MKYTTAKTRWQMANPIASTTGVADSVLKMSVGAGTNAHTIVGIITARKMTAA